MVICAFEACHLPFIPEKKTKRSMYTSGGGTCKCALLKMYSLCILSIDEKLQLALCNKAIYHRSNNRTYRVED